MKATNDGKGKFLEVVVAELERTLATNKSTVIEQRHKVLDRDGIEREIDIYIEVTVNHRTLKYAIECKHYGKKSPIKMQHIDTFYAMIANQGMKGIILTTGKVQPNAKLKAKNLNIDLYSISDSNEILLKEYTIINKRHDIESISLGSVYFASARIKQRPSSLYVGFMKKRFGFEIFAKRHLKPLIEEHLSNDIDNLFSPLITFNGNQIKIAAGRRIAIEINGTIKEVYFKSGAEYYPVEEFRCTVALWIEVVTNKTPSTKQYESINEEKIFATFLNEHIQLNGGEDGILSMIQLDGEQKPIFTLIRSRNGIQTVTELSELAEIKSFVIEK